MTVNPAATADPPPSSGDDIASRLRDNWISRETSAAGRGEEWHRDRQNLEQELAQRSETLSQLERKYKEDDKARQVLLHELRQEAKRMTADLEEARLANRRAAEERKQQAPTVHYEPPAPAEHPRARTGPSAFQLPGTSPNPPMTARRLRRTRPRPAPRN